MPLGRPKGPGKSKLDIFHPETEALLANGSTQRFIAGRYKTTEALTQLAEETRHQKAILADRNTRSDDGHERASDPRAAGW